MDFVITMASRWCCRRQQAHWGHFQRPLNMLKQKCLKLKNSPSYFYHLELSMRINAFDQWHSIKSTHSRVVTLFFTYLLHASHEQAWPFNRMFSMLVLCPEDPLRVQFDQYSNRHSSLYNGQALKQWNFILHMVKICMCMYHTIASTSLGGLVGLWITCNW